MTSELKDAIETYILQGGPIPEAISQLLAHDILSSITWTIVFMAMVIPLAYLSIKILRSTPRDKDIAAAGSISAFCIGACCVFLIAAMMNNLNAIEIFWFPQAYILEYAKAFM